MPQRYKKILVDGVHWSMHRYVWTQANCMRRLLSEKALERSRKAKAA